MFDAEQPFEAVILEEKKDEGIVVVNGRNFMINAKGDLVAESNIKPEDKLQDQTVRNIMAFARDLSAQISRFRDHTMVDLGTFDALLAEQYGAKIGGAKGNRTYQTIDGLMKIQVQVSDLIDFGPELQIAKSLVDECLTEWSAESRPEIQTLVTRAFNTEKSGQINKSDLFMLLNLKIEDERWKKAMNAIRGSIRVTGSKEYVRFYQRADQKAEWKAVTIDLAKAGA